MTSPYIIQDMARQYHVKTGLTLAPGLRRDLEQLATVCGMDRALARNAYDNDLIGICLTAQKDGASGIRTAKKVSDRLSDPAPEPYYPAPEPYYPAPSLPTPSAPDMSDVRRLIADALNRAKQHANQGDAETIKAMDEHAQKLAGAFDGIVTGLLEEEIPAAVRNAVAVALKDMTPTRLEVTLGGATATPLGLVHRDTAKIIQALAAGVNVYLHGPAGSGKTTVARKAAEAFKLQFYFAAKVESEYQLLGFTDAKGDAVRTPFREAYEHGGLFLFDEMDASSPAAVVALNAALANGICPFPDATVKRHADFHVIGAGNTKLTGANRQYAGRNRLDAASIDRFAFIEFGYDDVLERALATDAAWCEYVQNVRAACAAKGIEHLVTPRATYDGCKLLASGFTHAEVADMCVFKGLDASTVIQIKAAL